MGAKALSGRCTMAEAFDEGYEDRQRTCHECGGRLTVIVKDEGDGWVLARCDDCGFICRRESYLFE